MNRVLDFFLTFDEFDYSLTEIAENAGTGYSTLMLLWPKLEQSALVTCTRKVGKSRMFMLNKESPVVTNLLKLHWQIAQTEMKKVLNQPEIEAV